MKKLFTILFLLFLSGTNYLIGQTTDPVSGIYIDGVKVTELNCYSFGTMTLVCPYNDAFDKFDHVRISIDDESGNWTIKDITPATKFKYVKNGYLIYEIFSQGLQLANGTQGYDESVDPYGQDVVSRGSLQYIGGLVTGGGSVDSKLSVMVLGQTLTGNEQRYDEGCQCVKSTPTYSNENLYDVKLPLLNRKKLHVGLLSTTTTVTAQVDLSVSCSYEGTKVDFNSLGKSSGTTTTTATTSSTTSTSSASSASTTTPYSEKHDNGKIKVQGQKNKNGDQEGTWKYFDENGKLERVENYTNGIADGEWKYYEEGKLVKTEIYKAGELISTKEEE
jgi:hypothetical protein